jgi:hypothetical protein
MQMRRIVNGLELRRGINRHWYGNIGDSSVCFKNYGKGHFQWSSHHHLSGGQITRGVTLTECVAKSIESVMTGSNGDPFDGR